MSNLEAVPVQDVVQKEYLLWMQPYTAGLDVSDVEASSENAHKAFESLHVYITSLIEQGLIERGWSQPCYPDYCIDVIRASVAFNFLAWFDNTRKDKGSLRGMRRMSTDKPTQYLPTLIYHVRDPASPLINRCIISLIAQVLGGEVNDRLVITTH